MSVHVSSKVWRLRLPPVEKLVMLKLADCADDQGRNAYPAVQTIADEVGVNARTVQRAIRGLLSAGLIELTAAANRYRPNCYRLYPDRGDVLTPQEEGRGDTGVASGVTSTTGRGDIAVSPDPSLDPSIEPSIPPGEAPTAPPAKPKSLSNPRRPFTDVDREALRAELGARHPDFEGAIRKAMNSPGYQFGQDKYGHIRDWLLRDIEMAERRNHGGTTRRHAEPGDDELARALARSRAQSVS